MPPKSFFHLCPIRDSTAELPSKIINLGGLSSITFNTFVRQQAISFAFGTRLLPLLSVGRQFTALMLRQSSNRSIPKSE